MLIRPKISGIVIIRESLNIAMSKRPDFRKSIRFIQKRISLRRLTVLCEMQNFTKVGIEHLGMFTTQYISCFYRAISAITNRKSKRRIWCPYHAGAKMLVTVFIRRNPENLFYIFQSLLFDIQDSSRDCCSVGIFITRGIGEKHPAIFVISRVNGNIHQSALPINVDTGQISDQNRLWLVILKIE